jgi:hypothetical protein
VKIIFEIQYEDDAFACKFVDLITIPPIGSRVYLELEDGVSPHLRGRGLESVVTVSGYEFWENHPSNIVVQSDARKQFKNARLSTEGLWAALDEAGWLLDFGAMLLNKFTMPRLKLKKWCHAANKRGGGFENADDANDGRTIEHGARD